MLTLKEKLEHNHHQNTTITYNKISLIISEDKNNHLIYSP